MSARTETRVSLIKIAVSSENDQWKCILASCIWLAGTARGFQPGLSTVLCSAGARRAGGWGRLLAQPWEACWRPGSVPSVGARPGDEGSVGIWGHGDLCWRPAQDPLAQHLTTAWLLRKSQLGSQQAVEALGGSLAKGLRGCRTRIRLCMRTPTPRPRWGGP